MEIEIEKIIYPGKSLGRAQGKIILTDEGLPHEKINVQPVVKKKNLTEATTIAIQKPSPQRVTPQCPHYKICSPYQYIDYPVQLDIKKAQLLEILLPLGASAFPPLNVTASTDIWGYRNKTHLNLIWENNTVSFAYHLPHRRDTFVPIDTCFLTAQKSNIFLNALLKIIQENKLTGIKEIIIRESTSPGEIMVIALMNNVKDITPVKTLFSPLRTIFPSSSFLCLLSPGKKNHPVVLWGNAFLREHVGTIECTLGPLSFFQINTPMLMKLTQNLTESLQLTGKEKIADFYCGVGTFGLCFAQKANHVFAIESLPDNIFFLKKNITVNGFKNFTVIEGQSETWIDAVLKENIDTLIIDPPRKGIAETLCTSILKHMPRRIVYISCNPSTLTRDLKTLCAHYIIKEITLYDFFPHTPHIETCCILEKK